jgi:hypothetical protein
MLIAIDESGSFAPESPLFDFFVAVHIRQRKTFYKQKRMQFEQWENKLPRSLKDTKGEFKGSALSDEQLTEFVRRVIRAHYLVRITPVTIRATNNPPTVVDKHRAVVLIGVRDGTNFYSEQGRVGVARTYEEFGNWLQNLNYSLFVKLLVLGHCITRAMVDAIGHSVSARYDRDELPRMRFLIDRDFIKQPRHDVFWHEVLRNQLYSNSLTDPILMLDTWEKTGHPFVEMYTREDGESDYNKLFWKNCTFGLSHEHFEIRIADIVATILYRFWNKRGCAEAYKLLVPCFARDRNILGIELKDFDLASYRYDRNDSPLYRKWLAENS